MIYIRGPDLSSGKQKYPSKGNYIKIKNNALRSQIGG